MQIVHVNGQLIYSNKMQDAIGAMDGTHIPASVPTNEQMAYTNRHGTQSQNVLAVCDHDMRFVYVYAGWEGSAHDARVFDSALKMHTDFPIPPPGSTACVYFWLGRTNMDLRVFAVHRVLISGIPWSGLNCSQIFYCAFNKFLDVLPVIGGKEK